EARLRSPAIAAHGLAGPSRFALARRRYDRRTAPVRHLARAAAGDAPLPGQAARRGARDRAARAAAHRPRVLSARHLWRALAARSGVPGARRTLASVLVRGTARRLRDCERPLRRP